MLNAKQCTCDRLSSDMYPFPSLPAYLLQVLQGRFQRADRDNKGRIPVADLASICMELGSQLSYRELEGAILTLDVSVGR